MKRKLIAALLGCALLFAGCTGPTGNVEELLAAPGTGADQSEITAVLNTTAGGTVQLKYPRSGSYLSPFVFSDLNGDGAQEAMVFYADEQVSKNVRLAILAKADKGWSTLCDMEGLGTDIDAVELSRFYDNGMVSMVVGYTSVNLSDKHLAVYNFKENTLVKLYDQSYSAYAITDFTGTGTEDLVIISPETQPGPIELSLVTVKSGTAATVHTITLDTRLQTCTTLLAGKAAGDGDALVMDGTTAGGGLATDVLHYQDGRLISRSFEIGSDIVDVTAREDQALVSRDADGDGAVEAPVVLGSTRDESGEVRWLWVAYYDFAAIDSFENNFVRQSASYPGTIQSALPVSTPTPEMSLAPEPSALPTPSPQPDPTNEKMFGVYDLKYDCFVPLDAAWKNNVALRGLDGESWCIVRIDDDTEKLLLMQVVEKGGELADNTPLYGRKEDYTQVGSSNGSRLYVRIPTGATTHATSLFDNITVMS